MSPNLKQTVNLHCTSKMTALRRVFGNLYADNIDLFNSDIFYNLKDLIYLSHLQFNLSICQHLFDFVH